MLNELGFDFPERTELDIGSHSTSVDRVLQT